VTLTQTNQAETVLTLAIPAHVTYGFTQFKAEYGLTDTSAQVAEGTIYPMYSTRNEYQIEQTESSSLIRYGLYRNPDAPGMYFWTDAAVFQYSETPGQPPGNTLKAAFFASAEDVEPGRSLTPRTNYTTGTGYDKFSDRGTV
jgi:hypothetical protein